MDQIATLGKTLLDDITSHDYHNTEPQIKWADLKKQISLILKKASKRQLAKMRNKIIAIEKDIHNLEQWDDIDVNPDQRSNIALLRNEIQHLHQKVNRNAKIKAQAKWFEHGEKISTVAQKSVPIFACFPLKSITPNRI